MIIAGEYSFNKGTEVIEKKYPHLLKEIHSVIKAIDAEKCFTKESEEKTMPGKMLYSPDELNKCFATEFKKYNWKTKIREYVKYSDKFYTKDYIPKVMKGRPYREMDYLKEKLGIEVQFGKYAFMVYNVCGKMTIFNKLGYIDTGVEIVPIKQFADQMSTGVSYFEQFVWDLEHRGASNIDIPVLIYGIDSKQSEKQKKL